MGRPLKYDMARLSGDLFDLFVEAPDGLDIHQIALALDAPETVAHKVIRLLRLDLGENDTIAVPFRREGNRFIYFISADLDMVTPWSNVRNKVAIARLKVDISTWTAMVAAFDGRTLDGKKARYLLRSLSRLLEDADDLFPVAS